MAIACSTALRSNVSLDDALATAHTLGFEWVDLLAIDGWAHVDTTALADDWEATVSNVDRLLAAHEVRPLALNTGVKAQLYQRSHDINAQRGREIAGVVRLAQHLGVHIAAIQPRNADQSRPWREVMDDCVATLREQIAAGNAAGLTFALELHIGSPFETMEQARTLLDLMPDLALVYDPTHFVMQGIDIRETAWLMDHARHVHLRDAAKDQMQVPFGSGNVDFDWVLGTLKERGYAGHFSIEYLDTKDFDVLDSARRLHETIAHHFPA